MGVKQGDCLSPTLFSIFLNSLAEELLSSGVGLKLENDIFLNVLLCADDIVLMAEREEDLQWLLYLVESWCLKWRLEINLTKTNIMHVRSSKKKRSIFTFLYNHRQVEYCTQYKYLGLNLSEFVDFNFTTGCLTDSAGRALGSLCDQNDKDQWFPL